MRSRTCQIRKATPFAFWSKKTNLQRFWANCFSLLCWTTFELIWSIREGPSVVWDDLSVRWHCLQHYSKLQNANKCHHTRAINKSCLPVPGAWTPMSLKFDCRMLNDRNRAPQMTELNRARKFVGWLIDAKNTTGTRTVSQIDCRPLITLNS